MKPYYIKDLNDPLKYKIEYHSHPPVDSYLAPIDVMTGLPEEAEWLQIENIANPITGDLIPTVTVNQILKDSVLAARATAKTAKDTQDALDAAEFTALVTEGLAFDGSTINDLPSMRTALMKIVRYLDLKAKGY